MSASSSLVPALRAGMRVRVRAMHPFRLPRGLTSGAEVTLQEVHGARSIVLDDAGRLWDVNTVNLDPGRMVWNAGGWVPAAQG